LGFFRLAGILVIRTRCGGKGRSDFGKDLGHAEYNSCVPMNGSIDCRRSTFMHEQHSGTVKNLARCWTAEYFHLVARHSPQRGGGGPSAHEDVEPKPWNLDPCEGWESPQKTSGCFLPRADDFSPFSIEVGEQGGRRRGPSSTF